MTSQVIIIYVYTMNLKCAKILIFGRVQGVFFRQLVKKNADKLNIKGFTRNIPNGTVEIYAQSEEEILNRFIEIVKKGPETAKIEKINVSYETCREILTDFLIIL